DQELFWDTVKKHNNASLAVVKHWRPLIRGRYVIPVSGSLRIGVLERNDDNTVWRHTCPRISVTPPRNDSISSTYPRCSGSAECRSIKRSTLEPSSIDCLPITLHAPS